jgi:hypothetical protein
MSPQVWILPISSANKYQFFAKNTNIYWKFFIFFGLKRAGKI